MFHIVHRVYRSSHFNVWNNFLTSCLLPITKLQPQRVVMILSYSRKVLNQTGSGHFSPAGAYDPTSDMVLIMDVARFKYPPHWVPLSLLYSSMQVRLFIGFFNAS